MNHDPLCMDDSILIAGQCLGCEQVRVIREDTAHAIEAELEARLDVVPPEVLEVLRSWEGEPSDRPPTVEA